MPFNTSDPGDRFFTNFNKDYELEINVNSIHNVIVEHIKQEINQSDYTYYNKFYKTYEDIADRILDTMQLDIEERYFIIDELVSWTPKAQLR